MKNKILLLVSFVLVFANLKASEIDVTNLPDSLLKGANSVVLKDITNVNVQNLSNATIVRTRSIMVNNKKGEEHADFMVHVDKNNLLKKFKGVVYDSNGNQLLEIAKKDLSSTEYTPYLAVDDMKYIYDMNLPSYPYIVTYEWEISVIGDMLSFPAFIPVTNDSQALMENEYSIYLPSGMGCNYKVLNCTPEILNEEPMIGWMQLTFKLPYLSAFEDMEYTADAEHILPIVLLRPTFFEAGGLRGRLDSWKEMGVWLTELMKGRDMLTPTEIEYFKSLTDTCTSMRSKAEVLYNELRQTTRYVNISLGIGGLRPEKAIDVHQRGFGDCKALSNYMCTMLRAVGVPAEYAVISTEHKDVYEDFPSIGQFNHAIMRVLLPNDTVWLECTNPTLPFGYLHDGIAGHQALIVDGENSRIVRLPKYENSQPRIECKYKVEFTSDGCGYCKVEETYGNKCFEQERLFEKNSLKCMQERARKLTGLATALLVEGGYSEKLSTHPSCSYDYSLFVPKYCKITDKRMFVPVNIYVSDFKKYVHFERTLPIALKSKEASYDITLKVPFGYRVEAMPKDIVVSNEFGEFRQNVTMPYKDEVRITQFIKINSGEYSADLSPKLAEMTEIIFTELHSQIVLVK